MGKLSTSRPSSKTTFTTSSADLPPKNDGCGITDTDVINGENNFIEGIGIGKSTLSEEEKLKQFRKNMRSEPANHKRLILTS